MLEARLHQGSAGQLATAAHGQVSLHLEANPTDTNRLRVTVHISCTICRGLTDSLV
jgi:hypothetical protein